MTQKIYVCKKDEAYSYDEIEFLKNGIKSSEQIEKLKKLLNAIGSDKKSKAIFFMSLQTFNIFSMLQGYESLCDILSSDVEILYKELEGSEREVVKNNMSVSDSLVKKLKVLFDYLNSGEEVKPVCISADEFSEVEICVL